VIEGFQHDGGRDLSGYLDGTENPKGKKASAAAIVRGEGAASMAPVLLPYSSGITIFSVSKR